MKNNKSTALIANAITTAALVFSASSVFADSAKVFFAGNSHYYQRFDAPGIDIPIADGNCKKLNGHLVTFSGTDYGVDNKESDFVYSQLVVAGTPNGLYFIGAKYDSINFHWTWVTGEPFGNNFPSAKSPYIYLSMKSSDGSWGNFHDNGLGDDGYVCEWDSNHFVGSATVPDLNANGVDEIASLYLDYKNNKHTVKIRDPKTHATISTLTFAASTTPPIGLAVIADTNINGIPDIAVLSNLNVQIKDAKDNTKVLKSINFLNKTYQPRALSVMPDANGNGFDELTVLGILPTGKATTETRDSSTGAILFSDTF